MGGKKTIVKVAYVAGTFTILGAIVAGVMSNHSAKYHEIEKRKTKAAENYIETGNKSKLETDLQVLTELGLLNKIDSAHNSNNTSINIDANLENTSKRSGHIYDEGICGLSVDLEKNIFTVGESLTIKINTLLDCYLIVININSDGSLNKLYPIYDTDKNTVAHELSLAINAAPPVGTDILLFVASPSPFVFGDEYLIPESTGAIVRKSPEQIDVAENILKIFEKNEALDSVVKMLFTRE